MSFHRATLVALTTFFAAGTTSVAFAGCCQWGGPAPVAYAPPAVYALSGCGGCGAPLAVTYAPPVAPAPAPVAVTTWALGGCGCGRSVVYVAPPVEVMPVAPAPIYVVDQGPDYTGPGIMVPYRTYSPAAAWAPAIGYRYVPGPGYGYGAPAYYPHRFYHHPRYAYRAHLYAHPHYDGPVRYWRSYPRHPLGARG